MGQSGKDTTTKRNPDPYHTPDKPPSSGRLRRAPARLGSLAVTPGSGANPTSSHSTASTSKSVKRNPSSEQPTLTQIEFVQRPDTDDDFEYIGDSGKDIGKAIEIEDDEGRDNARDSDYKPPSGSRRKSGRGVRFDSAPPKLKQKSSILSDGSSGKGRWKSGDKKEKAGQKDDNTLTQMKYVQRIDLAGPDVDDAKLEYAYITPKKKDTERLTVNAGNFEDIKQHPYISEPTSGHKRIKLSPRSESKGLQQIQESPEKKVKNSPSTPRKPIRTEIPSSQSPESPGIAFMTSSQFHSATGLPQKKRESKPLTEPYIKKEQLYPHKPGGSSAQSANVDEEPQLHDPKPPLPSPSPQESVQGTPKAKAAQNLAGDASAQTLNLNQPPAPTQRTVVYETDAESDYGDFDDNISDVPSSPSKKESADFDGDDGAPDDIEPNYPETESQELPPPPLPPQGTDSGPLPSESNFLSDASICYQRLHPDTQFPLDPVPTINTQKMAELFPEESNGLHTLTPSPSSSPKKTRAPPTYSMMSQTQDPNEDQLDSQGVDKDPTEMVPESSPVARHEDNASLERRGPAARDVVVQVESSQPADRARRQKGLQDSAPRNMLTRSQILTSSVMESIPLPPFWLSSQDSVGEPYSQPDTSR